MSSTRDLGAELRAEIVGENFMSTKAFWEIVNEASIYTYLRNNPRTDTKETDDNQQLAEQISLKAPKLFAVLLTCGLDAHLHNMLEQDYSDAMFPTHPEFKLDLLNDRECNEFVNTQWKIAPLLSIDQHFMLPKEIRLENIFQGEQRKIDNGTFGTVYKVQVKEGLLEFVRKVIEVNEDHMDTTHEYIMKEVRTLRQRRHNNIVPIIFSFTDTDPSTKRGSTSQQRVNIIFPFFPMNMLKCMEAIPPWIGDEERERVDYLYQTVYQILQGLAFLHAPQGDLLTSHHDLKPKNILVSSSIAVIADLGKSCLKTLENGSAATEGRYLGTLEYCPPEYFDEYGRSPTKGPHGRAFDMWSMGCIMIEVAVLIVYGWGSHQYKNFQIARYKLVEERRPFSNVDGMKYTFCNSMVVVQDWAMKMQKDFEGSLDFERFRQYLDLASGMLCTNPTARLRSWEAVLGYYDMLYPQATATERLRVIYKYTESYQQNFAASTDTSSESRHPRKFSSSPLHRAAAMGDFFRVMVMLEKLWPLDLIDEDGKTPLDLAQKHQHSLVVCLLRHNDGFRVTAPTRFSDEPVRYILEDGYCGLRKDPADNTSLIITASPVIWPSGHGANHQPNLRISIDAEKCIRTWLRGYSKNLFLIEHRPMEWLKGAICNAANVMKDMGSHVVYVELSKSPQNPFHYLLATLSEAIYSIVGRSASISIPETVEQNMKVLQSLYQVLELMEKPKRPIALFLLDLHLIGTQDRAHVVKICQSPHFKLFLRSATTDVAILSSELQETSRWSARMSEPWCQLPGLV